MELEAELGRPGPWDRDKSWTYKTRAEPRESGVQCGNSLQFRCPADLGLRFVRLIAEIVCAAFRSQPGEVRGWGATRERHACIC